MSKSPKGTKTTKVENLPEVVNQENKIINSFDLIKLENQIERHKTIGSLFDKAADVLENYLDDPNSDLASKMFPAKLATDIYLAQEKFRREDERILIEKRRISLEEAKAGVNPSLVQPSASKITNQQNNYFISGDNKMDLTDLKKKQEEILASFRNPNNTKT